jgi:hypothetical protein
VAGSDSLTLGTEATGVSVAGVEPVVLIKISAGSSLSFEDGAEVASFDSVMEFAS